MSKCDSQWKEQSDHVLLNYEINDAIRDTPYFVGVNIQILYPNLLEYSMYPGVYISARESNLDRRGTANQLRIARQSLTNYFESKTSTGREWWT